jgi:hypothetical protein
VVVVGGTDGIGLELVLQCVAKAEATDNPGTIVIVGRKGLDELLVKFATDAAACALFKKCNAPTVSNGPCLDLRYVQLDVYGARYIVLPVWECREREREGVVQ